MNLGELPHYVLCEIASRLGAGDAARAAATCKAMSVACASVRGGKWVRLRKGGRPEGTSMRDYAGVVADVSDLFLPTLVEARLLRFEGMLGSSVKFSSGPAKPVTTVTIGSNKFHYIGATSELWGGSWLMSE